MTEPIIDLPPGPTFEGKPGTDIDQARERSNAKRAAARNAGKAAGKVSEVMSETATKKHSVVFAGVLEGAVTSFYVPNVVLDKLGNPGKVRVTIEAA